MTSRFLLSCRYLDTFRRQFTPIYASTRRHLMTRRHLNLRTRPSQQHRNFEHCNLYPTHDTQRCSCSRTHQCRRSIFDASLLVSAPRPANKMTSNACIYRSLTVRRYRRARHVPLPLGLSHRSFLYGLRRHTGQVWALPARDSARV